MNKITIDEANIFIVLNSSVNCLLCSSFANVVRDSISCSGLAGRTQIKCPTVWAFVVSGTQMSNENCLTVGLTRSFGEDVCTCCSAASFERRSRCRALGTIIRLDLAFFLRRTLASVCLKPATDLSAILISLFLFVQIVN